jgi:hypothetical protein
MNFNFLQKQTSRYEMLRACCVTYVFDGFREQGGRPSRETTRLN